MCAARRAVPFFCRVRMSLPKFGKRRVHLYIVRNKPYGQGWIFVLKIAIADALKQWKDAAAYKEQIG
jgi:hypothetical protein